MASTLVLATCARCSKPASEVCSFDRKGERVVVHLCATHAADLMSALVLVVGAA